MYEIIKSGNSLEVLRVRDRHERILSSSEWTKISRTDGIRNMEWSPEAEGYGGDFEWSRDEEESMSRSQGNAKDGDNDDGKEEDEQDDDEEDMYEHEDVSEEAEREEARIRRIEDIAESLYFYLADFPKLHTLVLPLKFGPILRAIEIDPHQYRYEHFHVIRLVATCDELGVEIKVEERLWETDLAYKELVSS